MPRWYKQAFALQVLATLLCFLPENRIHAQQKGVVVEESGYSNSARSLVLLRKKPVQDELKLDRDQRAKLEEIASTRPTITDPTERRKKNAELGKAAERLLSPTQLARFKELSLQAHGIGAMTDSVVTEALGITGDQLTRLQTIQVKFGEQLEASPIGEREKRYFELHREAMNEVMAMLTAAQREKFEKMRGEPVDVETLLTNKAQKAP
jgi:hypothetical protein